MKTISFEQIRAIVAQQPQPIDARIALAPKGHACVAGYRFIKALRDLDPRQRAEVLAVFGDELRSVIATLAAGA